MNVLRLSFSFCFLFAASSSAQGTPFDRAAFEKELNRLSVASREEAKRCEAVYSRVHEIAGKVAPASDPTKEFFSSKDVTMKVAALIDGYPGMPPSGALLITTILNRLPEGIDADLSALFRAGDCSTLGFMKLTRHLLSSAKHFTLSATERVSVGHTVLTNVRKDAAMPMDLLHLMVRLATVRQLVDVGLLPLGAPQLRTLSELENLAQETRKIVVRTNQQFPDGLSEESYREMPIENRRKIDNGLRSELRAVEAIRSGLVALLSTIKDP